MRYGKLWSLRMSSCERGCLIFSESLGYSVAVVCGGAIFPDPKMALTRQAGSRFGKEHYEFNELLLPRKTSHASNRYTQSASEVACNAAN
jgi:hypothetical protein